MDEEKKTKNHTAQVKENNMFQKWGKKIHSIPHDSLTWHLDFESLPRRHCVAHEFISIFYRLKPAYSDGWSLSCVTISEFFNWTTFSGMNALLCVHPSIHSGTIKWRWWRLDKICFITKTYGGFLFLSHARSHKSLFRQQRLIALFPLIFTQNIPR